MTELNGSLDPGEVALARSLANDGRTALDGFYGIMEIQVGGGEGDVRILGLRAFGSPAEASGAITELYGPSGTGDEGRQRG